MTTPVVEVREGRALLRLPAAERSERAAERLLSARSANPADWPRGPESKETAPVFYNPAMALNRDLASLLFATRAKEGWHVLDGLAASGARGLRYALEADARVHVQWNDWNPAAVRLLQENAALNGLEPNVTHRNLNPLLHEYVWHCVELDPYGSPAPFLDAATRAVRGGGLLGVTATDTTGLAGVFPNVCERRYLARPLHGELGHEVALRILAGAAVRQAAKHEVALRPLLAHATDHYYRVTLAAERGATRTDNALRSIGMISFCPSCGHREVSDATVCPACGGRAQVAGPLWTGGLEDAPTTAAMLARADAHPLARREEALALLRDLDAESRAPALFYDIHRAGQRCRTGSPPTAAVVAELEAQGFGAWPVHFNRLGVRTRATAKELDAIVRAVAS